MSEIIAFRSLGPRLNPSIITLHGSFARAGSYNVILEYADKDTLADYFKTVSPPTEGEEIIQFWECMFSLLSALEDLHQLASAHRSVSQLFQKYVAIVPSQIPQSKALTIPFNSRQKYLKPETILVVSNGSENPGIGLSSSQISA